MLDLTDESVMCEGGHGRGDFGDSNRYHQESNANKEGSAEETE